MKRNNSGRGRRRRKKKKKKKKNPLLNLPHELITQILLRLPVKSLIRFKCVCKSWFSVISDPHFANSHFQLTSATHTPRILFTSPPHHKTPLSVDVEASLHGVSAFASLNHDFLLPDRYCRFDIKGSCRGFVVLQHCCTSELYLWNPSTGLHKQIPLSPHGSNLLAQAEHSYGLGYDESTDDYLVVLISYYYHDISSYLEFFSLRDNTWKQIKCTHSPNTNSYDYNPKAGCLYNGAIHWLAYRYDLPMDVIVAFDFTQRKLLDIHFPDDYEDFNREPMDSGLWVFGEFLSLWARNYDNGTVSIWVMKEYKVNLSWTKTLILPVDGFPTRYFTALCCTKNGDIIGTYGGTDLVKYDDNGQLLEHSSINRESSGGSQVAMYTPSLLSLPCDNEQA